MKQVRLSDLNCEFLNKRKKKEMDSYDSVFTRVVIELNTVIKERDYLKQRLVMSDVRQEKLGEINFVLCKEISKNKKLDEVKDDGREKKVV